MSITSFFQPRASASVMPAVTRTALPRTPTIVRKPASTPSAIVVAWDNVLFPTKWMIESLGLVLANKTALETTKRVCLNNPFTVQALTAIEQQVLALLAAATAKAPVYVLSDYSTSTIDALCSAFFPRLKTCLANANGRVHIIGNSNNTDRAAWKLNVLQQICSASMQQANAQAAVHGASTFKVLAVSADELDLQVASRVQEMVARVGTIQTLALPAALQNGKPLSLVNFHKQVQAVTAALAV